MVEKTKLVDEEFVENLAEMIGSKDAESIKLGEGIMNAVFEDETEAPTIVEKLDEYWNNKALEESDYQYLDTIVGSPYEININSPEINKAYLKMCLLHTEAKLRLEGKLTHKINNICE